MMESYRLESRSSVRWRSFSIHVAIFAAGALLMMCFLNYGAVPDRSASKLSILSASGPPGTSMSRRGLYTSSSSGECGQQSAAPTAL